MLAVFILLASWVIGLSFVRLLSFKVHGSEVLSLSYILGIFISSWLLFGLAALFGYTTGITLFLLGASMLGFYFLLNRKNLLGNLQLWDVAGKSWLLFLLFWLMILGPLFYTHLFYEREDGLYSGGSAWGDLAIHASLVHKFSNQNVLDLTSPIYAQEKTNYPFFIDFYAGILNRTGLSLQLSLLTTSFFLLLAVLNILYFSLLKCFKSSFIPWITTLLFMGSGGLGFLYFWQDWQTSQLPFSDFLQVLPNYAHMSERGFEWSNFVTDYLLPQRGYVMGLAIFVVIFRFLWEYWSKKSRMVWLLGAVLIGLLPLFHPHTFLTLVGIYFCFGLYSVYQQKMTVKEYVSGLTLLAVLGFTQIYWQFLQTPASNSFITYNWGWMKQPEEWFIIFWLKNMGVGFLFMIFGSAYFFKKEPTEKFIAVILVPLLILFFICNLVLFQPFAFDNMKFMLYSYLLVCIATSYILEKWWQKGWWPVVSLVIALMTLSGAASIYRESTLSWQISSKFDLTIVEEIKQKTEPEAIFLTADTHTHPVVMLAGRSTVLGYRGWLWSHGINYQDTEREVIDIFAGNKNAHQLIKKHQINYIYVSPLELEQYTVNTEFLKKNFEEIINQYPVRVFKTTKVAGSEPGE